MFIKSFVQLYLLNKVEKRLVTLNTKRAALIESLRDMNMLPASYESQDLPSVNDEPLCFDFYTNVNPLFINLSSAESKPVEFVNSEQSECDLKTEIDGTDTKSEPEQSVEGDDSESTVKNDATSNDDVDTEGQTEKVDNTACSKKPDVKTSQQQCSDSDEADVRVIAVDEESSTITICINNNPKVDVIDAPNGQISKVSLGPGRLKIFNSGKYELLTSGGRIAS